MTTESLMNADIATYAGDQHQLAIAPIKFCDTHHAELLSMMDHKGIYRELEITHAINTLAARTIGTTALCLHRCPICAFKDFDFIAAMVSVFAEPGPVVHKPEARIKLA